MFLFFYIVLGHVVFLPAALRQGRCEFFDDMMFYVFWDMLLFHGDGEL